MLASLVRPPELHQVQFEKSQDTGVPRILIRGLYIACDIYIYFIFSFIESPLFDLHIYDRIYYILPMQHALLAVSYFSLLHRTALIQKYRSKYCRISCIAI